MGTAGYMSPEQASGQPVDFHSDQFTLGTILYEMATGKQAFQRKTGAETLVAIIREEPEPLSQLAPKAPAPVRWIVERLLAKDPEERYASTKDLARDLKSVRDHLTETSFSGGLEAAEPAKPRRRRWAHPGGPHARRRHRRGLPRCAASHNAGADTRSELQRLTWRAARSERRASPRTARRSCTAPPGTACPLEIFTTRVDSSESRSLGLPRADVLAVSSSGELAISLDRHYMFGYETVGTLARVPLAGGAPREVLETVEDADWSPDGKILAVARQAGTRCRLEYPIGTVIHEAAGWINNVRVSPDGELVAFIDHPQRGDNIGNVRVVDRNGKVRLDGPSRHPRPRLVAARRRGLVGLGRRRHRGHHALGQGPGRLDLSRRIRPGHRPRRTRCSCS